MFHFSKFSKTQAINM